MDMVALYDNKLNENQKNKIFLPWIHSHMLPEQVAPRTAFAIQLSPADLDAANYR